MFFFFHLDIFVCKIYGKKLNNFKNLIRSRCDELEYAKGQGVSILNEENSPQKPNKELFESYCLPRILDVHMKGFITHVSDIHLFRFPLQLALFFVVFFSD